MIRACRQSDRRFVDRFATLPARVERLFRVETFAHVRHLYSEHVRRSSNRRGVIVFLAFLLTIIHCRTIESQDDFQRAINSVQNKIVKVYGAGGRTGLEAYQSGMLVSSDGTILTVWSYVLDVDPIIVVLNDGRKFDATLKGYDPRIEIALLKIDATDLDHFELGESVELTVGQRVLAFSNLFGVASGEEDASVLHGHVSASTRLDARRGAFQSTYTGNVLIVDAMTNNPGAAGGALTDSRGRLAGILGKELRSSQYNTWLNYAIPINEVVKSVDDINAGRWSARMVEDDTPKPVDPVTLKGLGIVLIHDALDSTPPYVDRVIEGSPAHERGLKPDDLILFVNDRVMRSIQDVRDELSLIERDREINIALRRGDQIKTITIRGR